MKVGRYSRADKVLRSRMICLFIRKLTFWLEICLSLKWCTTLSRGHSSYLFGSLRSTYMHLFDVLV